MGYRRYGIVSIVCSNCDKPIPESDLDFIKNKAEIIKTGILYRCPNCGYEANANPEWILKERAKQQNKDRKGV